jgi:NAD(P)-dependent dehydrogenase (short-subunit alcohol dehydrogenase family)
MWEMMLGEGEKREENLNKKCESIPMGHMGTPEDVASGVLFLACDDSKFVTGTELIIDGGALAGSLSSPHKIE